MSGKGSNPEWPWKGLPLPEPNMPSDYASLLQPGRLGAIEMRNRIVMAPMGSNFAEADGHCGERIQAYYEARARGGAGLLIMGVALGRLPGGHGRTVPGRHLTRRFHSRPESHRGACTPARRPDCGSIAARRQDRDARHRRGSAALGAVAAAACAHWLHERPDRRGIGELRRRPRPAQAAVARARQRGHRAGRRVVRRGGRARGARRFRLRRDPRRPRLRAVVVPVAALQPARRRLRR
jgi:hypothetical protein